MTEYVMQLFEEETPSELLMHIRAAKEATSPGHQLQKLLIPGVFRGACPHSKAKEIDESHSVYSYTIIYALDAMTD